MPTERISPPKWYRRVPKKGCLFTGVRITGWFLIAIGVLLVATAVLGFIVVLVKIGPTLAGSLRYSDHKMAGFVFILSITYLLIFPVVGMVGATSAGLGLALWIVSTHSAVASSRIALEQVKMDPPHDPPMPGTG